MSNLQFQSFTNQTFDMSDEGVGGSGGGYGGRIGDGSQEEPSTTTTGPKRNFFSFAYYQQYFDVDTDQVFKRIVNSVIPTHKNFITEFVQPVPDLYGPFWICVTLVFSIGIFSNIAQYIENEGGAGEYGSDFRMVTGASSLIMSYVLIIPFIISTTLWYRKSDIQYSFLEVVCAYGYSLAIFIPVSMLWIIDVNVLRWTLIFASVFLSGGVLVRSLAPAFRNDPNKLIALGSVIGIVILHFGLALCFKEYFFDAAMPSRTIAPISSTVAPPPPAPTEAQVAALVMPNATSTNDTNKNATRPETAAILAAVATDAPTVVSTIAKAVNSSSTVDGDGSNKVKKEEIIEKKEEKKENDDKTINLVVKEEKVSSPIALATINSTETVTIVKKEEPLVSANTTVVEDEKTIPAKSS